MSDSLEPARDCNNALVLLNRDLAGVLGADVCSELRHEDGDTSSIGGSSTCSGGDAVVETGVSLQNCKSTTIAKRVINVTVNVLPRSVPEGGNHSEIAGPASAPTSDTEWLPRVTTQGPPGASALDFSVPPGATASSPLESASAPHSVISRSSSPPRSQTRTSRESSPETAVRASGEAPLGRHVRAKRRSARKNGVLLEDWLKSRGRLQFQQHWKSWTAAGALAALALICVPLVLTGYSDDTAEDNHSTETSGGPTPATTTSASPCTSTAISSVTEGSITPTNSTEAYTRTSSTTAERATSPRPTPSSTTTPVPTEPPPQVPKGVSTPLGYSMAENEEVGVELIVSCSKLDHGTFKVGIVFGLCGGCYCKSLQVAGIDSSLPQPLGHQYLEVEGSNSVLDSAIMFPPAGSSYSGPENICQAPGTRHSFRVRSELGCLYISLASAPPDTELRIDPRRDSTGDTTLLRVAAFAGNVVFSSAAVEDGLPLPVGARVAVQARVEYTSGQEDDDARVLLGVCSATGCTTVSVHGANDDGVLGARSYNTPVNTRLNDFQDDPEVNGPTSFSEPLEINLEVFRLSTTEVKVQFSGYPSAGRRFRVDPAQIRLRLDTFNACISTALVLPT